MPPSSSKCPCKSNLRGETHPWALGVGLEDHWVFLGGSEEVGGPKGEGNWLLHSVHLQFLGEWLEERAPLPELARRETQSFSHSAMPHRVAKEAVLLGGCEVFLFFEELDGSLDLGGWSLVAERCLL